MAKINRFEEVESWKKARELANEIYKIVADGSFSKDYSLRDQITRASGSVMDNIAEGFGRGGRKEFINFLIIAKGSCNEVQSQLYRALDRQHISQSAFDKLYNTSDHTSRMIARFIEYLKTTTIEGIRPKEPNNPKP